MLYEKFIPCRDAFGASCAACEANGSYDTVVYCADCGEELSRETVTIPMTSHTGGTATCLEKAICEICGQPYGELAPHTPGTEYDADEQIIGVPVRFAESK